MLWESLKAGTAADAGGSRSTGFSFLTTPRPGAAGRGCLTHCAAKLGEVAGVPADQSQPRPLVLV